MSFVNFWFQPSNHKKWFANNPLYDAEILKEFGSLLMNDVKFPLNESTYNMEMFLENILICDQLTRHYDRVNGTDTRHTGTDIAVTLSQYIIDNHYEEFLQLTPEKQCFIILPLRHTRQLELVKQSITLINQLMEPYINDSDDSDDSNDDSNDNSEKQVIPNIYLKFYKASLECLADIMIPTHYPPTSSVDFPDVPGLLDPECQFDNEVLIGYNKTLEQLEHIPDKWIQEFKNTLPPIDSGYNNPKIIISLSGGGDSMATSYILRRMGYDVTAVMIDYNNRESCKNEIQMVHWWCSELDINLYILHIEDLKRSRQACFREIYEPVTRKMRFNAYKKVSEMIGADIPRVILGHNRDDSFENIISNLTKRRSMYNLKAIKPYYLDNAGVWVYRPFKNIPKSEITQFLQNINGPYLYDSTPKWSFRGRTRDVLVPQMNSFNPNLIGGLEDMADKMFDMSQRYFNLLEKSTKFEETTTTLQMYCGKKKTTVDCIRVDFMADNYTDTSYWQYIFEQIMMRYKYPMIGNKAMLNIITRIEECSKQKKIPEFVKVSLILNMECRIFMDKGYMLVYLRPKKPNKE